jgi:hypothetical protein
MTVISVGKQVIRFQIDPQVAARALLARVLWLQGFPDQAMRIAERSVRMRARPITNSHFVMLWP